MGNDNEVSLNLLLKDVLTSCWEKLWLIDEERLKAQSGEGELPASGHNSFKDICIKYNS